MKDKAKHKVFIEDNNIDVKELPDLLQKRITAFEDWTEQLQYVEGKDKEKLESKIAILDLEIEEDLYDHFEDNLCNNEECEIPKKEKPKKEKVKKKCPELSPEETALKALYEKGNTKGLTRSFLLELGIPDPKGKHYHEIGNYSITQSSYFTYR